MVCNCRISCIEYIRSNVIITMYGKGVKKLSRQCSSMKSRYLLCENLHRQFYQCDTKTQNTCGTIKRQMDEISCDQYGFEVRISKVKKVYHRVRLILKSV